MSEFTPGPWELSNVCSCDDDGDCERPSPGIDIVARGSTNKDVVRVASGPPGLPYKANAQLIAAAPEMYEALDVIAKLASTHSHWDDFDIANFAIRTAAAALAKAEGKR